MSVILALFVGNINPDPEDASATGVDPNNLRPPFRLANACPCELHVVGFQALKQVVHTLRLLLMPGVGFAHD